MKHLKLFEDFILENEIDIEALKKSAAKIKHCGDYGHLFVNKSTNEVWWNCGDADGTDDTTSLDDIEKMLKVSGVKKVHIEAECNPSDNKGFTKIEFE